MANEVAKTNPFGGSVALPNREEMAKKAAESAQVSARQGAPDGSEYLNFSGKRGLYTIGKDKIRVDNDETWVLNIASIQDGFVCWKGGRPESTRLRNIYRDPPIPEPASDELGPFDTRNGEGWHRAMAWVSKSLDTGLQGYFKNNSVSGVSEMGEMLKEISRRLANGEPAWPVFHYDMDEFEAKGHKNFKPEFIIVGWLDDEAILKLDEEELENLLANSTALPHDDDADDDEPEETPKKAKAQSENDRPATTRRRRRSAA